MKNTFKLFLILLIIPLVTFCKKEKTKSSENDILTFTVSHQTGTTTIDAVNHLVVIEVENGTVLTDLKPEITISEKASCEPQSDVATDFSQGPVTYILTAEDGTKQEWKVSITALKSSAAFILSFTIPDQKGVSVFSDSTITIVMNSGAALDSLIPEITVSPEATIIPSSGSIVDFSEGPVKFIVTAGDGSTKEWMVDVTKILSTENNILSVTLSNQTSSTISGKQCLILMPFGTDFTSFAPEFTLSPGATITPLSGQSVDFSQGSVTYVVTSESGKSANWNVIVTLPLIAANNANIKYVGRIDYKYVTAPRFANPGVYIKAKFTGTICDIEVSDETDQNYIEAVIDNQPPVRYWMRAGRRIYRVASGLSGGEHTILLCKDTEAGVGGLSFYGFRCEGLNAVTDLPVRKIECYGNSITVGACMLLGTPCDLITSNWNAPNCAYLSYGALTARALNADWQLTAVSGIGLIHSCCGMTNELPDVYDRLDLNSSAAKWDFTKYVPDVVTICLGQNDGSEIVLSSEFKYKYIDFIDTLRGKYPDATIFCVTSPMADVTLLNAMKSTLTYVVDSVNNAGDSKVFWVELPHGQLAGCPGNPHPSVEQHAITAGVLEAAIKDKMGW
jgi:hypothetical protein